MNIIVKNAIRILNTWFLDLMNPQPAPPAVAARSIDCCLPAVLRQKAAAVKP